eukprot:scaffold154608_cov32-Tisochrysis_lutea.AAC.2
MEHPAAQEASTIRSRHGLELRGIRVLTKARWGPSCLTSARAYNTPWAMATSLQFRRAGRPRRLVYLKRALAGLGERCEPMVVSPPHRLRVAQGAWNAQGASEVCAALEPLSRTLSFGHEPSVEQGADRFVCTPKGGQRCSRSATEFGSDMTTGFLVPCLSDAQHMFALGLAQIINTTCVCVGMFAL